MEKINKYQSQVLKRLANSSTKVYAAPAGLLGEDIGDEITADFNDILRLIEMGLLVDISETPEHKEKCADLMNLEGRDIVLARLSRRGQLMFERKKWEKWVN